jgi:vacuolar iron transporter family protein
MAAITASTPDAGTKIHGKLNWLRAGVLGANDGIMSIAGIVMGVAGANASSHALLIAGMAGLVAGALSMAGGEYVSVSSQKDTELAALEEGRKALAANPEGELDDLTEIFLSKGVSPELSRLVAVDLSHHDALGALAELKLGIDAERRTSPWHAAWASMAAFTVGAMIPLLAMVLSPVAIRIPTTVSAVTVALLLTGVTSARLGGGSPVRPMLRNVVVGTLAMAVTYFVGHLVGVQLG